MKKTYMIPAFKVADIENESLICESQVDGLTMTLSDEVVETEDYTKADKSSMWDNLW